jgi:vacuolar-type H+-ATPase subunit D/Vma8
MDNYITRNEFYDAIKRIESAINKIDSKISNNTAGTVVATIEQNEDAKSIIAEPKTEQTRFRAVSGVV